MKMKKWMNLHGVVTLMNLCALAVVISNANLTCAWLHHQPKVPEAVKKFRKF